MTGVDVSERHFHAQLATLKQRLTDMSTRAEELVDIAVDALLTRDKEKADAVIRGDHDVDHLEIEVEHLAIALLALQQPMGRDLRFIISAIKISSDMERIGDHAVNIAQSALRITAQRAPTDKEFCARFKRAFDWALSAQVTTLAQVPPPYDLGPEMNVHPCPKQ